MSEEVIVYRLTELTESFVDKYVESMSDWLAHIDVGKLEYFHSISSKDKDDWNEDEEYDVYRHAIVIYCRELKLDEISINEELLNKISGLFCTNIIIESLIRRGIVYTIGPLYLYKSTVVKLTDTGTLIGDRILKNDEK